MSVIFMKRFVSAFINVCFCCSWPSPRCSYFVIEYSWHGWLCSSSSESEHTHYNVMVSEHRSGWSASSNASFLRCAMRYGASLFNNWEPNAGISWSQSFTRRFMGSPLLDEYDKLCSMYIFSALYLSTVSMSDSFIWSQLCLLVALQADMDGWWLRSSICQYDVCFMPMYPLNGLQ